MKFEQLRIFFPLLRIYRQDVIRKIEYVDGGRRYKDLGPLENDEVWSGATRTKLAEFAFSARYSQAWFDEGYAWDPRHDVSAHMASVESECERHEAFYSMFQIFELDAVRSFLTLQVDTEFFIDDEGCPQDRPLEWQRRIGKHTADQINVMRKPTLLDFCGSLCQLISDRYHPKTQSDQRTIRLTSNIWFPDWNWYEYARQWRPREVMTALQIADDELRRMYEVLARRQAHIDPLEHWYKLVRFISVDQRDRLKGDALRAKILREMALMLKFLYEDATGERLPDPNEIGVEIFRHIPEAELRGNPLRYLEYVANDFRVNPRPSLTLIVEGGTEESTLPEIFDHVVGTRPGTLGIEIVNLGGVDNVAGSKEDRYRAVVRLVDYLHHHQTICVVLVDNEGPAIRLRQMLQAARSTYHVGRFATRRNYLKVWNDSFELDNFSDTEIAGALSELAGTHRFTTADVKPCRRRHPRNMTLARLYEQNVGTPLHKPALGQKLVEIMFAPSTRRNPLNRPIAAFVRRLTRLATGNHPPPTDATWESNQLSGYLGTPVRRRRMSRRRH